MFKASTARSPVQLTAYTGFRGRSTSSRTVQPQASKDKYNPPAPAGDRGHNGYPQLCSACHSDPATAHRGSSNVRLSAAREPVLPPGYSRVARARGVQLRWTRVPPSARGVPLASPLVPSTRAARGPASPCCLGPEQPGPPLSTRPHEAALVASAPPTLLSARCRLLMPKTASRNAPCSPSPLQTTRAR